MIKLNKSTHGSEDVLLFASGPRADFFSGVMDQHVIPHLLGFASCVSEGHIVCVRMPYAKCGNFSIE